MYARYADGRAAVTHETQCGIGVDALSFRVGETSHSWSFAELRRADDGNGRIILKRKPDTGERLMLASDAETLLRVAAPSLFAAKAFGVEGLPTVGALAAAAWSLAAAFLIGVPMAAEPLASVVPPRYRAQIAEISWSQVEALTEVCDDSDEAERILNATAYRIMETSDVSARGEIWISIVDASFPNAFALPDNSIVVTDELIRLTEQPDELMGVIAHEIAHIERNHIMKNIIRHVGAGIFFDVVFGGAGAGQAIALASVNLAGLRYSRGDETEADETGLDYLEAANIDTGGLARLFDRFAETQGEQAEGVPTLLSSHPATAARAASARARAREGLAPSISENDWRLVRAACGGSAGGEQAPARPVDNPPGAPVPVKPRVDQPDGSGRLPSPRSAG